jgi:hypothetical protein
VRDAESRFAVTTGRATGRSPLGGRSTDLSSFASCSGTGAPATGRTVARLGVLALLVASLLALSAAPAPAAYLHNTVVGEYGKEGPKASGTGDGCRIGWHAATERIYLYSDTKIYALHRTSPGNVTPVGGSFPVNLPSISSSCGDRDLGVDNSATGSAGNIYVTPSAPATIYGYNSSGAALGSPWPVSVGSGENCGVAVGNTGDVFGGFYSGSSIKQYSSAGSLIATIPFGQNICKLEVDPTNNDIFGVGYGSQNIFKLTAESGYSTKINFPSAQTNNPGLAVNGVQNRLYVAAGSTVRALDTDSGNVVETFSPGGSVQDVAVDEATDTVFTSGGGVIKEISGAIVPDITTGNPEGNSKVTGKVETAGGGEITECYFEFGTTTSYGSKEFCSPPTPYVGPTQEVFANLPGLLGETTYHYRLVAHNANGKNSGGDKTITPHYVEGLATDDAENVTRTGAKMKGHFTGNGEETKYYFEWGPTTAYSSGKSAVPPGDSVGEPTGLFPLEYNATGLLPDTLYHYRVVATNSKGTSPGNDKTFKTLPAVQSLTTGAATNITAVSATLNGSYNGDGDATTYYYKYGPTLAYGQTTSVQPVPGDPTGTTSLPANVSGLTLDTLYHYKVVATNSLGTTEGADQTFTTKKAVENLVTLPASEINDESIQLNAEFEGTGLDTHYYFEYGPTTAYGLKSEDPPGTEKGVTTGPTSISSVITEFEGFTTYHYRVVASNTNGTTFGNDVTFETTETPLPGIEGTSVSSITSNGAMLSASVNPNHWPTVYLFEWGPSLNYGSSTLLENPIGGLENESIPVQVGISGLTPGTLYHFRAVAVNFAGTTNGPDHTFVTPGPPRIESSSSSAIGQTTAHLSMFAAGAGSPTNVSFEYGPSQSYGSTTPPRPIGADLLSSLTEADLTGLTPGTTYHFRAVASNAVGTTYGPDQTFTTQPKPTEEVVAPPPPKKCRKGFVKKHGKCVKKRKHKKKHRKKKQGNRG